MLIAIVPSDGPANVGDLFVDLSPVVELAIDYRQRLLFAGPAQGRAVREWLTYYRSVLSWGTREASGLWPTVAS